jgi:hypothetical protein
MQTAAFFHLAIGATPNFRVCEEYVAPAEIRRSRSPDAAFYY